MAPTGRDRTSHKDCEISSGCKGCLPDKKQRMSTFKAFWETDFTEDLKKFDVPTLIIHGDDDQIAPIGASAMLSSKMVKGATQ